MKVLFVSAEVAPFAKVGGLADVAGGLPKALKALGVDVRIAMPAYQMILDSTEWQTTELISDLPVNMNRRWSKSGFVKQTYLEEVPVYLLGTDEWFNLSVDSGSLYQPGGDLHLWFSRAVMSMCESLEWLPDVLHANDWHTGFLPVLVREQGGYLWKNTRTLFSVHNLAYQGEFGVEVLDMLDLPRHLFNHHQLEAWGRVNFLKAGMMYADQVNTVSPNYAREIQTPQYGQSLEGLMGWLHSKGRLNGILNGIDQDVFDPLTDKDLPNNFSSGDLIGKAKVRSYLLKELGLKVAKDKPIYGMVSRISDQKGFDLVVKVADQFLSQGAGLVIQGLGDPAIIKLLKDLQKKFPNQMALVERFDAPQAQRVYAGCDAFLMPSAFEPCGLGQMIAMRYGTVPIVRATGGLADTVFEGENGFVFYEKSAEEFAAAIDRSMLLFTKPAEWKKIQLEGMTHDWSWTKSAKAYSELYSKLLTRSEQLIGI